MKRYKMDSWPDGSVDEIEDPNGDWVSFADHEAEMLKTFAELCFEFERVESYGGDASRILRRTFAAMKTDPKFIEALAKVNKGEAK